MMRLDVLSTRSPCGLPSGGSRHCFPVGCMWWSVKEIFPYLALPCLALPVQSGPIQSRPLQPGLWPANNAALLCSALLCSAVLCCAYCPAAAHCRQLNISSDGEAALTEMLL
ncbi:hypothetical protein LX32DRAFT_382189 [Colletotrichum zoysiae]|uniref:Uncharacterized protein n=1 Tax=Colletotrichum zoysiae TaxID=1216348 RepID=A0AAD9HIS1_9PEZI|nr:hypothetical protein LX32DRAFT_382189 [Colletotrichum zoysiae]